MVLAVKIFLEVLFLVVKWRLPCLSNTPPHLSGAENSLSVLFAPRCCGDPWKHIHEGLIWPATSSCLTHILSNCFPTLVCLGGHLHLVLFLVWCVQFITWIYYDSRGQNEQFVGVNYVFAWHCFWFVPLKWNQTALFLKCPCPNTGDRVSIQADQWLVVKSGPHLHCM